MEEECGRGPFPRVQKEGGRRAGFHLLCEVTCCSSGARATMAERTDVSARGDETFPNTEPPIAPPMHATSTSMSRCESSQARGATRGTRMPCGGAEGSGVGGGVQRLHQGGIGVSGGERSRCHTIVPQAEPTPKETTIATACTHTRCTRSAVHRGEGARRGQCTVCGVWAGPLRRRAARSSRRRPSRRQTPARST